MQNIHAHLLFDYKFRWFESIKYSTIQDYIQTVMVYYSRRVIGSRFLSKQKFLGINKMLDIFRNVKGKKKHTVEY